jgi:hypothetical protein
MLRADYHEIANADDGDRNRPPPNLRFENQALRRRNESFSVMPDPPHFQSDFFVGGVFDFECDTRGVATRPADAAIDDLIRL